ncbi:hypothetical protein PO909_030370 [Leuciscus waleckii]
MFMPSKALSFHSPLKHIGVNIRSFENYTLAPVLILREFGLLLNCVHTYGNTQGEQYSEMT